MDNKVSQNLLILIPNVLLSETLTVGEFTFTQGGTQWLNEFDSLEESKLLREIIKMLQNEGLSSTGVFAYCFFDFKTTNRNEIYLRVRKSMAILRFAAIEHIPYFVFRVEKLDIDIPEMLYYLHDVLDGPQLHAPGVPNNQHALTYPINLNVRNDYYLIKKYNENDIEDKYISAIEWYNRIFEQSSDIVENMIKLAVAFEKIRPLKTSDKAKEFGRWLCKRFDSTDAETWGKDFYKTRGAILHGNEFYDYPRERQKNKPKNGKKCIYWRNPEGHTDYTTHAFIGQQIFKYLLEEEVTGEDKRQDIFIQSLRAEFIDQLLVPNEVRYKDLQQLISARKPLNEHFEIISNLSKKDLTGDEKTIYSLLRDYLQEINELVPSLSGKITEISDLIAKDDRKIFLELSRLSKKVRNLYQKQQSTSGGDDNTIKLYYLSRFFEIASLTLSRIFWYRGNK